MKRIALLAVVFASACTGTYYPYSSGPQYASVQSTQQVTESSGDGTTTTSSTSSTETYQFEASESQPTQYAAPAPAQYAAPAPAQYAQVSQASYEAPPPAPSLCDAKDSQAMCTAWTTMVDIGDILAAHTDGSCRKAAADLNRYANQHAADIEVMETLESRESHKRLKKWEARHQADGARIMTSALDLSTRCEDDKVDRALARVGFRGLPQH